MKPKTKSSNNFPDLEEIQEYINGYEDANACGDLPEIGDNLWHIYFLNKELTNAQKKDIRDVYNRAAKVCNKIAGKDIMQIITPSTKWIPKHTDEDEIVLRKTVAIPQATTRGNSYQTGMPKAQKQPGKGGSIIEQILALHQQGLSNKDIIAKGFNKSTVNRQVSEFKKRNAK